MIYPNPNPKWRTNKLTWQSVQATATIWKRQTEINWTLVLVLVVTFLLVIIAIQWCFKLQTTTNEMEIERQNQIQENLKIIKNGTIKQSKLLF